MLRLVITGLCAVGLGWSAEPTGPAPTYFRVVVTATPQDPKLDLLDAKVFRKTLFTRDDQLFHLLDGGINAGQHEGGGKSVEVRRFGFNLDHGGVSGGLRVTIDGVPQNQSTQGHGQGYLGSLKSVTPELVGEVSLIDGPFSAEHGDFSGLGVVEIRLKESLPEEWTFRMQGGNYGSRRGFVAWSPDVKDRDILLAYDGSHTDGPFLQPLDYARHNLTGNYSWHAGPRNRFSVKFNGGWNEFQSSGQIPLDEVAAGRLDRFGLITPGQGGDIRSGRAGLSFQRTLGGGAVLKADGFVERSLFDLYSNFTYLLNDPVRGDEIQQHDSRLSQGASFQYLRPQVFDWGTGLLTAGGNLLATQTQVELRQSVQRNPVAQMTSAHARVTNAGGYVQEAVDLFNRRLEVSGALRWDLFRFGIRDRLETGVHGSETAVKLQPKLSVSVLPLAGKSTKLFYNYGRGIASLDARGVVRRREGPHIATTDFHQTGLQQGFGDRVSLQGTFFLIRPSRQLVYIPDDGSIELAGPSRSHGFQAKASIRLTRHLRVDGGVTKVLNAYFRDTKPRIYLDSAPRFTASAGLTLSGWKGWSGSLRMRAINRYRLDGRDPSILAVGHTVFDLAFSRRLSSWTELNFSVDNLFNREYWETQNHFASRLPGQAPRERIHGTPGYGTTVAVGLTLRLGEK